MRIYCKTGAFSKQKTRTCCIKAIRTVYTHAHTRTHKQTHALKISHACSHVMRIWSPSFFDAQAEPRASYTIHTQCMPQPASLTQPVGIHSTYCRAIHYSVASETNHTTQNGGPQLFRIAEEAHLPLSVTLYHYTRSEPPNPFLAHNLSPHTIQTCSHHARVSERAKMTPDGQCVCAMYAPTTTSQRCRNENRSQGP